MSQLSKFLHGGGGSSLGVILGDVIGSYFGYPTLGSVIGGAVGGGSYGGGTKGALTGAAGGFLTGSMTSGSWLRPSDVAGTMAGAGATSAISPDGLSITGTEGGMSTGFTAPSSSILSALDAYGNLSVGTTPAGGAGAATKPGGTSSSGQTSSNLMGGLKDYAPLIMLGEGILQRNQAAAGISELKGVADPALAAGQAMLARAQAGQLTPQQQAVVDKYTSDESAKWKQYLANAGISDSSSAQQVDAYVQQQAAVMSQQFVQQTFQEGIQALQMAEGPYGQIAQLQAQKDKALQDALGNAMQSYGYMNGWFGK